MRRFKKVTATLGEQFVDIYEDRVELYTISPYSKNRQPDSVIVEKDVSRIKIDSVLQLGYKEVTSDDNRK